MLINSLIQNFESVSLSPFEWENWEILINGKYFERQMVQKSIHITFQIEVHFN